MTLREVTRTVIALVENASGYPVAVQEDRSAGDFGDFAHCTRTNRIHSISFNPSAVSEPDYLICYQCGFILRLLGIPAAHRFDLVGTVEGRQIVTQLLAAPDGAGQRLSLPWRWHGL